MVMRGSQKFKFVVDCPPDVVREQQENLTMFLSKKFILFIYRKIFEIVTYRKAK